MKTTCQIIIFSIMITFFSCKKETIEVKGIDISKMDKTISPKEDFFNFVNGNWLKNTKIPADRTVWGSFNELRKQTDDDVLTIVDELIKKEESVALADADTKNQITSQQKAIYLYNSTINFKNRNKQGIKPLQPFLNKIDKIKNLNDVQNYITNLQVNGSGGGFYGIYVGSHPKNSTKNAVFLGARGLGLRRSYYVDQDKDTKEKRKKYQNHIAKMLQFIGDDKENAVKNANAVLNFETTLATPQMSKEERRDARKRFNPMTIKQLKKLTPAINWSAYLNGLGVNNIDTIIVTDPNYFKALHKILKKSTVKDWKNYFRWSLIDNNAGSLTKEIDIANWEFFSKVLRGAKEQRKIEERALNYTNGSVGEAIGELYVAKHFPPEAKAKAKKMIDNIMLAFGSRIKKLNWMSENTKKKALEKLGKMTVKIAYPDQWKTYEKLIINKENSYFQNQQQVAKFNFNKNISKIGKPVDKTEWHMNPQTVNAYFNPPNNEIVFPAAILQPPFYNHLADDAVNYGGIGAVIGHEISHSFDDSGSRYDGDGNLVDWWTEKDLEKFGILGKKLEDQFSKIEALPNTFLNGKYTLGENIGDLGGVNVAYDALQLLYKEIGTPDKIDEFTGNQRFFMSWATVWRTKMRDDALKNRIKTDPHAPGMYRAFMPLKNIDAFYKAFDIKLTDKMYLKPEDRVLIW